MTHPDDCTVFGPDVVDNEVLGQRHRIETASQRAIVVLSDDHACVAFKNDVFFYVWYLLPVWKESTNLMTD